MARQANRLASPYLSLVLQFQNVRGMEIERRRRARVGAAELRVAAITHGDIFQPAVDDEIDERDGREDAVRDEVAVEPIKDGAHDSAGHDDRHTDGWIEILPDVEVRSAAHWTSVDCRVRGYRIG